MHSGMPAESLGMDPRKPDAGAGAVAPHAGWVAVLVLYVLPLFVWRVFGPLAWIGLMPGAIGLRWTTLAPHRRRLVVLYLVIALVSFATLALSLSAEETVELRTT